MKGDLLKLTKEQLHNTLRSLVLESKEDHDMSVYLGSLSVSPKYMTMYFNSIESVRTFKSNNNL